MAKIKTEKSLWIRQNGGNVQGPFPVSRIRGWINKGKVRPEMNFSLDGNHWMPGDAVPGLFESDADPESPAASSKGSSQEPEMTHVGAFALGLLVMFIGMKACGGDGPEAPNADIPGHEQEVFDRLNVKMEKSAARLKAASWRELAGYIDRELVITQGPGPTALWNSAHKMLRSNNPAASALLARCEQLGTGAFKTAISVLRRKTAK